jgi:hypothetical protein
MTYWR